MVQFTKRHVFWKYNWSGTAVQPEVSWKGHMEIYCYSYVYKHRLMSLQVVNISCAHFLLIFCECYGSDIQASYGVHIRVSILSRAFYFGLQLLRIYNLFTASISTLIFSIYFVLLRSWQQILMKITILFTSMLYFMSMMSEFLETDLMILLKLWYEINVFQSLGRVWYDSNILKRFNVELWHLFYGILTLKKSDD